MLKRVIDYARLGEHALRINGRLPDNRSEASQSTLYETPDLDF